MKKKKKISDADKALFREETKDVRRLQADKIGYQPPRTLRRREPPLPRHKPLDEPMPWQADFSLEYQGRLLSPDVEVEWHKPGVQPATLRRLKRGLLRVDGDLDLHGMSQAEARDSLERFLLTQELMGHRCLHIIHGKGYSSTEGRSVLKTRVAQWLSRSPNVIAFCSSQPRDGGRGALYVLLRRS